MGMVTATGGPLPWAFASQLACPCLLPLLRPPLELLMWDGCDVVSIPVSLIWCAEGRVEGASVVAITGCW